MKGVRLSYVKEEITMCKITDVTIVTDGACSGNPGPGGWCALMLCEGKERVLHGHKTQTTNNEMELTAVVQGLHALRYPCTVKVLTDSAYIVNQINGGYLEKWAGNGWRTSTNQPVQNLHLWQDLRALLDVHTVTFVKVKGHSGDPLNERADHEACCERDLAKIMAFSVMPV